MTTSELEELRGQLLTVASEFRRHLHELIRQNCKARVNDANDDHLWSVGMLHFNNIMGITEDNRIHQECQRGLVALRDGQQIDLTDRSKEDLDSMLMAVWEKFKAIEEKLTAIKIETRGRKPHGEKES